MKRTDGLEIVRVFGVSDGVPRSSEGDFVRLPDGGIMFAYSRYSGGNFNDDQPSDIYSCVSRDGGLSFSEPGPSVSASAFGEANIMSVTLRNMADGSIGLFFGLKHGIPAVSDEYLLMRSYDGGRSFGDTVRCIPERGAEGYYVINNCRVERLSCGRLLIPTARHIISGNVFDGRGTAMFYASDDDGRSWRALPAKLSLKSGVSRTGLQEPGAAELPDGRLMAYFRTDVGCQYMSFSGDLGESWSEPEPSLFTSPMSPMKIARDPYSGYYISIYNPVPAYNGREIGSASWGRTPLAFAVSRDGLNYSEPYVFEDEEGRGYCYPAVFFTGPGELLLSYCSGGPAEKACLARTTLSRLRIDYKKIIG